MGTRVVSYWCAYCKSNMVATGRDIAIIGEENGKHTTLVRCPECRGKSVLKQRNPMVKVKEQAGWNSLLSWRGNCISYN